STLGRPRERLQGVRRAVIQAVIPLPRDANLNLPPSLHRIRITGVVTQNIVVARLRVDPLQRLVEVVLIDDGDPAGLLGDDAQAVLRFADVILPFDRIEWQNYIRESQNSLRVIAEQTGGIAVVNQNDFDKALKRIDSETSDYYVLGYYSSNPDTMKRRRQIEIRIARKGNYSLNYRTSYTLKPLPRPPKS